MGKSEKTEALKQAIAAEAESFERAYLWLEEHMPPKFLAEVDAETRVVIARNLLSFALQNRYTPVQFPHRAIVLCADAPDADLKILKNYTQNGIRYYRAFVSNAPPPGEKEGNLRIALIEFKEAGHREPIPEEKKKLGWSEEELRKLTPRFLHSMPAERLQMALNMYEKAKTSDLCQYEIKRNEQPGVPSLQLVMAWRGAPKAGFLYRLAKIIHAHGLALQKVVATYVDPYSPDSVLILSLGLHGMKGPAWEEANIDDLLAGNLPAEIF